MYTMKKPLVVPIFYLAYRFYKCVWQEYQKMGSDYLAFMDKDTVSCLQFGYIHMLYKYTLTDLK